MKPKYRTKSLMVLAVGAWIALTTGNVLADEAEEEVAIPDTLAGIWQSIDEQVSALDGLLASGDLDEVHHHAIVVQDLVRALPAYSQDLDAEVLEQVNANIGYVETLATRLDDTGDAGDVGGTKINLGKLKRVLERIRVNYPDATP